MNTSWSELDSKIDRLSDMIEGAQPVFGSPSKDDWTKVFQMCKELSEAFKEARYPKINDRDKAWQTFFDLRERAYKVRQSQLLSCSQRHYDDLISDLRSADYDMCSDFLIGNILTIGLLKVTPDEMKAKAKQLAEIMTHFKLVKNEMTKEHIAEVFKRIMEVRQNHDGFWGQYKRYQEERSKVYEEKQRAWQEKQERGIQIKERIERNIENNEEILVKAREALDRFERNREELQDKIYDSRSDNWRSKAEGWLDEIDAKIRDIESQIARIENWIEEDRDKLHNWK